VERTDEVGARASALYFFELYSYGLATADFTEWDAMAWETCNFCSRIRGIADGMTKDGSTSRGGELTLYDVQVGRDDLLGGYPVQAMFAQAPATRIAADGSEVLRMAGNSGQLQIDMIRKASGWKVLAVTLVDKDDS
jgi:hypothetical protein